MPDPRVAHALLRLYPRAWRGRYGDEFLALVEDQGLSWRAVVDVVGAAGVERVRSAVETIRGWDDPATQPATTGVREWIADRAALVGIFGAAVVALGVVGVPHPTPRMALQFAFLLCTLDLDSRGRFSERIVRLSCSIAAAATLAGVAWLTALIVTGIGVPMPTEPTLAVAFGIVVCCGAGRGLYRAFGPVYQQFRRPGEAVDWPPLSRFEVAAWSSLLCTVAVAGAMVDPGGETYWAMALTIWVFVRLRRLMRSQGTRGGSPTPSSS